MAKRERRRPIRLPLWSWLLYLCVALLLTTGVTYSRYIASSAGGDGARTAQFGELTLTEDADSLTVLPGVPIAKDPRVTMTDSQVAVRVSVDVTFGSGWIWQDGTLTSENGLLRITPEPGWTLTAQQGNQFCFSWDLAPGQVLTDQRIFQNGQIEVLANISYEEFYNMDQAALDISIEARAEQID